MNDRSPILLTVGIIALVAIGWLLIAGPGPGASPGDTSGAVFSSGDRDALNAAPVGRGATPAGPNPSVDLTDARAVSTAYVAAAYSLRDSDAGRTNRRAVPYAAPSTQPGEVGVLALVTPPPGRRSEAVVTDVTQVSGEPSGNRRGYLVGYHSVDLAAGAPDLAPQDPRVVGSPRETRYLLLIRQFDGRWLVANDTTDAQVGAP
jgi:hypothetical protein